MSTEEPQTLAELFAFLDNQPARTYASTADVVRTVRAGRDGAEWRDRFEACVQTLESCIIRAPWRDADRRTLEEMQVALATYKGMLE